MDEKSQTLVETLKQQFPSLSQESRWAVPFPMGVFGTLRQGCGNHRLMGSRQPNSGPQFSSHLKAFLPDFVAVGIHLEWCHNSCAPFEIYVYEPGQWQKMIPRVDMLEGFSPGRSRYRSSYHRTLANLHVLPDDFDHPLFRGGHLYEARDLAIPVDDWSKFPAIPCWIYSSIEQNEISFQSGRTTLIWDDQTPFKE